MMARKPTKGPARTVILLSLVLGLVRGDILNQRNVNDILYRNQCFCPCKPMLLKEYYIPISRTNDWFGAVAFCNSVGMEMAEVLNESEANALRETIAEEGSDPDTEFYWIGANDLGKRGRHTWALTGRNVSFTQWDEGEPNNAREDDEGPMERCAAVAKDTLKWNDFQCHQQKKFVCQRFRDE